MQNASLGVQTCLGNVAVLEEHQAITCPKANHKKFPGCGSTTTTAKKAASWRHLGAALVHLHEMGVGGGRLLFFRF